MIILQCLVFCSPPSPGQSPRKLFCLDSECVRPTHTFIRVVGRCFHPGAVFWGRCYPPPSGSRPWVQLSGASISMVWGVNIAELMTCLLLSLFSSHALVPLRARKRVVETAVGLAPVPMGVDVCLFIWTVVPGCKYWFGVRTSRLPGKINHFEHCRLVPQFLC
ncbi:unnamed protein product [Ectocarpus sp. 12 AP-2014]